MTKVDIAPLHLTIHIGPHKTGTTALQTACASGARTLAKSGVLYPKVCWHKPAQHRLAFAAKGRNLPGGGGVPDYGTELRALATALASFPRDRALISSEELFACPPEAILRLRDVLPDMTVQILTFLRRPDDFLVSSWNQKIRQPGNGFCAPIRRFVADPLQFAPEIDYARCIGNWAAVFGDGAIRLEVYEGGPPLPRTLALLGLPPDLLPDPTGVNRSVPGAVAECLRHAKLAGLSTETQRRLLERAQAVFADGPGFHLTPEDRRKVLAALEPANDALFRRFGKVNPFTPGIVAETEDRLNLSHKDLMRLVETLL